MTEDLSKPISIDEDISENEAEESEQLKPKGPKPRKRRKSWLSRRDPYGEAVYSMTGEGTKRDAAGPEPDRWK